MWAVLFLTLPTQPNAVRLRVWRALKTLGCAALRDGAYLLPRERRNLFAPLVSEVRAHRGQATVLDLSTRDEGQRAELLARSTAATPTGSGVPTCRRWPARCRHWMKRRRDAACAP